MRTCILLLLLVILLPARVWAQEPPVRQPALAAPLTISAFSEAISLPNYKGFVCHPNLGIRLGTELYYRQRAKAQLFQTVNLGYYHHATLHHGLYLSSELGYRKHFGSFFLDGTLGGGYLHLISTVPVYKPGPNGDFAQASPHLSKFMPTLGLGTGYRLPGGTSLFARLEVFGEMPVKQAVPVLPHKALHLGARIPFFSKR